MLKLLDAKKKKGQDSSVTVKKRPSDAEDDTSTPTKAAKTTGAKGKHGQAESKNTTLPKYPGKPKAIFVSEEIPFAGHC